MPIRRFIQISRTWFTCALLAIPSFAIAADPAEWDLLSHRRNQIRFPELSANDKQLVADQALYFIKNFYAHLALKERAFGFRPLVELRSVSAVARS